MNFKLGAYQDLWGQTAADLAVDLICAAVIGDAYPSASPSVVPFSPESDPKLALRAGECDLFCRALKCSDSDLRWVGDFQSRNEEIQDGEFAWAILPRLDARDVLLIHPRMFARGPLGGHLCVQSAGRLDEAAFGNFISWAVPQGTFARVELNGLLVDPATLLREFISGQHDAVVVPLCLVEGSVKSAAKRLPPKTRMIILPRSVFAAPFAQGAIAIGGLCSRPEVAATLAKLHSSETVETLKAEAALLRSALGEHGQLRPVTAVRHAHGVVCFACQQVGSMPEVRVVSTGAEIALALDRSNVWPPDKEPVIFKRRALAVDLARELAADQPLFVAKDEALPQDAILPEGSPVFVPGVSTWRRLCERGVWVSGCADGLGEDAGEFEAACKAIGFSGPLLKLTHAEGVTTDRNKTVATYELVPTELPCGVEGCTHFFWKSGSSFLELVKRYPWIRQCHHGCGLGHTAQIVQRELGASNTVGLYPSFEHFLSAVLPSSVSSVFSDSLSPQSHGRKNNLNFSAGSRVA